MGRNKLSLASCVILLVLVGLTAGLSSCGGGGGSRPVTKPGDEAIITPPENQAPIIVQTLEDITPPATSGVFRWESEALTEYFSDPDGDTLQFSAQTDNADVSSVEVSETGELIVRVSEPATARISVTATDPRGASATQQFSVTVTGSEDTDEPPPTDHSDTQAGAVQIAPGQTVRGDFHSADDVDWLRLDLPEPGLVELQFDAPTGAEISVFDVNGNLLTSGRTQSVIAISLYIVNTVFVRVAMPRIIARAAPWVIRTALASATAILLFRTYSRISITPGLEFSGEFKDYIACRLRTSANNLEPGSDKDCPLKINSTATAEVLLDGIPVGTLRIEANAVLADIDCIADHAKVDVSVPVKVAGLELFSIPVPAFDTSIPIPLNIGHPHKEECRPKARNPRNPGGTELSISPSLIRGGSPVSITLIDHIRDPREGKLSFSDVKAPKDLELEKDSAVWKIKASSDAEVGEKIIEIIATSTKGYQIPLHNIFTLRVSVSGECGTHLGALMKSTWYNSWRGYFRSFSVEYTGACSDGLANGRGTFTAIDLGGSTLIYDGEWENGAPSGDGNRHVSLSDIGVVNNYNGKWRNGYYHGEGTGIWEYANANARVSYIGTWHDGRPHGQGEFSTRTILGATLTRRDKGEFRNGELWTGTSESVQDDNTYISTYTDGNRVGCTAYNDEGDSWAC